MFGLSFFSVVPSERPLFLFLSFFLSFFFFFFAEDCFYPELVSSFTLQPPVPQVCAFVIAMSVTEEIYGPLAVHSLQSTFTYKISFEVFSSL